MKKIFRDPIHGLISFDKEKDKLLLKLIDTYEFQRLRRIRQLGVSWFTYPTAVHTRFSHSIGVAYLAGKIFDRLLLEDPISFEDDDNRYTLSKSELKLLLQATALLHDIGHGPFSHAFETVTTKKHEVWSSEIIKDESTNVNKILMKDEEITNINPTNRKKFPQWISSILNGIFPLYYINEIISSQLDADRLDYLLRDAYMCGVGYAKFDLEWILNNISVATIKHEEGRKGIVVNAEKGIHSLESFIISRYHMYEQVYFHKTTRAAEKLIYNIFRRLKELIINGGKDKIGHIDDSILDVFTDNINIINYLKLDDFLLISYINKWSSESRDELLKYLCSNFINRNLYKLVKEYDDLTFSFDEFDKTSSFFKVKKLRRDYYLVEDSYTNVAYKDDYLFGKKSSEDAAHIWLVDKKNALTELAEASPIIKALRNKSNAKYRIYCDRSIYQEFIEKNIFQEV